MGGADSGADTAADQVCSETHPDWTVGLLMCTEESYAGYTLFAPSTLMTTFLIDIHGRLVHSWESDYRPGLAVYLLENGNLLRTASVQNPGFQVGGAGGLVQEIDWEGNVVWEFEYSSDEHLSHHDVKLMPNGNLLMLTWETKTEEETVEAGRNPLNQPGVLWMESVIEVAGNGSEGGDIVWKWNLWDHLVQDFDAGKNNYAKIADHPELVDFNYVNTTGVFHDWIHMNSVDYNEQFDQIVLSAHNMSELWVIDHGTTTSQAASHAGGRYGIGGDILYRWGNPQVYRAGGPDDQKLFGQHDVGWIDDGSPGQGNLLMFNNGLERPDGKYSSVDEIVPQTGQNGDYPLEGGSYGPENQAWIYVYDIPASMYSRTTSGAERLPNGNTLITVGPAGHIYEVTQLKEIVWEYISPVTPDGPLNQGALADHVNSGGLRNGFFKARRYGSNFPGLEGKDLSPKGYLEGPPI